MAELVDRYAGRICRLTVRDSDSNLFLTALLGHATAFSITSADSWFAGNVKKKSL